MEQSAIAYFPFKNDYENNSLRRAKNITETILSAVRAYIVTPIGSRLGNMVGCFVPSILNTINSIKDLNGLAQRLKSDLITQFPGVNFIDVKFTLQKDELPVTLVIEISLTTPYSDNIEQIEIVLPTNYRA